MQTFYIARCSYGRWRCGRKARDLSAAEPAVVEELTHRIQEGGAKIIGLARQELLSGIKTVGQYEKLRGFCKPFPMSRMALRMYEAAARADNECRPKGVAVSVSEMLICAGA